VNNFWKVASWQMALDYSGEDDSCFGGNRKALVGSGIAFENTA